MAKLRNPPAPRRHVSFVPCQRLFRNGATFRLLDFCVLVTEPEPLPCRCVGRSDGTRMHAVGLGPGGITARTHMSHLYLEVVVSKQTAQTICDTASSAAPRRETKFDSMPQDPLLLFFCFCARLGNVRVFRSGTGDELSTSPGAIIVDWLSRRYVFCGKRLGNFA